MSDHGQARSRAVEIVMSVSPKLPSGQMGMSIHGTFPPPNALELGLSATPAGLLRAVLER